MSRATPEHISIPRIDVSADVVSTGVNDDGTVEVPSLEQAMRAGWYRNGPSPGESGAAVVLGHVSAPDPAVFYNLGALLPGDTIEITRDDQTVAMFVVVSLRSIPKGDFPTADVYGPLDHAGLRLVTCGGSFDQDGRTYRNNVVVNATFVASRAA